MQIHCTVESHAVGGPGSFWLGKTEVLAPELLSEYGGKAQLIYLDPPFRTGESFSMRIGSGRNASTFQLYEDKLSSDDYVSWMRSILTLCHGLLSNTGSLYLHLDYRMSAKMRIVLDEIFGEHNFMNEIIWTYKSGGRSKKYFPRKHDTILFYRKSAAVFFDIHSVGFPRGPMRRNHMKRFIDEDGRIGFSIRSNGKLYKYYEDDLIYPSDVWNDIEHLQQKDRERTGFATQKPEALLRRIIGASSKEGDLVMDLFSGSGTTAAVAAKTGRRFVAVDTSPVAMYMLRKRLLEITGTVDLFDQTHSELDIRFPDKKDAACTVDYRIEGNALQRTLHLNSAMFDGSTYPVIYAATGIMEQERFITKYTNCSPKFPLKLTVPDGKDPVLQVQNAVGEQAFIPLS